MLGLVHPVKVVGLHPQSSMLAQPSVTVEAIADIAITRVIPVPQVPTIRAIALDHGTEAGVEAES
jgi:hypothetical protein